MAAMIYADILQDMDFILITSILDYRREIMKLEKNRD